MTRSRKIPAAGPEPHDTAAQQGFRGDGSTLSSQPEALHQSILDNLPGALLLTGEQGEILFASKGVEEVFGLPRERVLALDSVEELLGPDLFDPAELDAKGELTGLKYTSRLPSDSPRDILITVKKFAIGNSTKLYSCCEISAEHCQIQSHGQALERMATIFDNLLAGIAVCDSQGRFIQANPACEAIFGCSQQDILGRTLADFIFDEDRQRYLGKMQEILTNEGSASPYRVERRFKTKAGKPVWLDMSVSAVTDDNGHVRNLIAVFSDVTERHLTEEQLRWELEVNAALTRLYAPLAAQNATLENMSDTVVDMARRITKSGQGLVVCFDPVSGRTRVEAAGPDVQVPGSVRDADWMSGLGFQDASGPDNDTAAHKDLRQPFYANSLAPEQAGCVHFLNHEPRRLLYVPVLLGQELAGQIVLLDKAAEYSDQDLEAVRRMSEFYALSLQRMRFREALMESEEKMRLIIESSPIGIRITQQERYVYVNPAFVRMLGYDRADDLIGTEIDRLYMPEYRALIRRLHKERLSQGKGFATTPAVSTEVVVLRKDGQPLDAALWLTPITYQGGHGVLGFMSDISEARTLRRQLLQAQKLEAIGTLAGGVAHDFNNILAGIIGYAELAQLHARDQERVTKNLDQVLRAATRATDLVKQILSFSRHHEHERKPIQVAPVVKESLKLLRASLPATITITQDLAQETGTVLADPTQVHQIIMNLCTNAAFAMQQTGGTLEILMEEVELAGGMDHDDPELEPGAYLKIVVRDTGEGIAPEIQERIFDPYFSTKPRGVGSGLGLAVVRGIVKSWSGSIRVHSEPGTGSSFEIHLPRTATTAESSHPEIQEYCHGHEHILFVDDEPFLTEFAKEALEMLGYRVTTRTSPLEALELFKKRPQDFDLLITDYTMPGMTGDRFASEILRFRPELPIIMCTGFSERISPEKAHALGITEFVMKPLIMKDLGAVVRKALDRPGK